MDSLGVSFVVSRMTLMPSCCTLSSSSRLDCDIGCVTQTIVSDAEYHTPLQQEVDVVRCQPRLSIRTIFFSRLSFVDLTCVLYVCIPLKWIPRYLRLFVPSPTFLLKETADTAFGTALLLRVHHRTWLELALVTGCQHQCDTSLPVPGQS